MRLSRLARRRLAAGLGIVGILLIVSAAAVIAAGMAPVANGDSYQTPVNQALTVNAPGVLTNDTDAESDPLTAVLDTGPPHAASFTLNSDGSFDYTPVAAYRGPDSFTYHANDGTSDSNIATVTIVVDTAPVAVAGDGPYTVDEHQPLAVNATNGVLANDTDADGDSLTAAVDTGPSHASSFTLQPDGSFDYTPVADYNGPDSFTYDANDGLLDSNTVTVNLTVNLVNDAPTFTKGPDQTVDENAGTQTVAGWATGFDPGPSNESGQAVLNYPISNDNNALFSVQPDVSNAGTLTFTPAPNTSGSATVTVQVQDNGGTANGGVDTSVAQTFTITVNPVNQPPSFTKGGDKTVLEDSGAFLDTNWATAISPGPPDESWQSVFFIVTNDKMGLFTAGGQPDVNASGDLTFTPAADANGTAIVTVTAVDNGSNTPPSVNHSAPQTFHITITAVNDAPSFTKGANQTGLEDGGLHTSIGWATNISAGPADEAGQTLTFNVTGDTNAALFSTPPAVASNGTLTYTPAADANGSATITLDLMDNGGTANGGDDTSAIQTFTISVTAVNDAPTFTKGADEMVLEDAAAQSVPGWATGFDPGPPDESGQVVANYIVTNNNNGLFSVQPDITNPGTLTYTLAANANGVATVTVKVQDNGGVANGGVDTSAPQTFTITVTPVNDAPSFTKGPNKTVLEDAGGQSFSGWATSVSAGPANESGQTLTFIVTNDTNTALFSSLPAVASNGTLTFTPAADANGSATVTLELMDNGGTLNGGDDTSATQTFTITVTAVNDAPSFTKGSDQTVLEDAVAQSVPGWATGFDPGPPDESGQTILNYIVTNDNNPLFAIQPDVSNAGTLTYTLAANANGVATVSVQVQDSGGVLNGGVDKSVVQIFTITVTAVNDAPTFTKGAGQTVLEDAAAQSVVGWATGFDPGPANESSQTVLNYIVTNNNNPLFSVQPDVSNPGTLTYTLTPDANGSATVTVKVQDNGGVLNGGVDTSAPQTFTITVTAVNDAPSFIKGADQTVLEDAAAQSVVGWATGFDPGPPNESSQTLVNYIVTNNNNGLFSVQPDVSNAGTLTYTLTPNANGVATVTVRVQDDGGVANGGVDTSAPQTFTITVTAVNDAPTFTKGADQTVLEDAAAQSVVGWATGFDPGPPNESSQIVANYIVTNDNNPLFSIQPDVSNAGTLTYTLTPNANGVATVTVKVQDNGGIANGGVDTSAPQTFTITVTAVNDAPTFTKGPDQAVLEDAVAQSVSGWATGFDPGPANESGQTILNYIVTNDNNALFSVQPDVSNTGTLTYTLTPNANGVATVTVRVQDSGGVLNGGVDKSAPQTFTITVTAVNDAPSFASGGDVASLEDTAFNAPWATGILAGPPNESSQTLTFAVTGDTNVALFSVIPAIAPDGTLTYAPVADANGMSTITVDVMDNGGTSNGGVDTSAAQMFTITVTAVNDAPTFTKGPDQVVNEDAGPKAISAWATAFSPGPSNEAGQTVLAYHITGNTNTPLFSTQPAVAPNGTLTYTSAANANGVATIMVTVQDNGGTGNGGVDTSAAQTFTITVNPINDAPTANGDVESVGQSSTANQFNVLSNDFAGPPDEQQPNGANAQTITIQSVTQPAHGHVTVINGNTAIDYVPTAGFVCPASQPTNCDTFTYIIADNGPGNLLSAPATVFITVTPSTFRFSGADRYATDAAIVSGNYGAGQPVVYVASGVGFADGLTGAAAAGFRGAPLILVNGAASSIPNGTKTALNGVIGPSTQVIVLGGTGSIDTTIFNQLSALTPSHNIIRLADDTRYNTAVKVSLNTYPSAPVASHAIFIASGLAFPDALAAAAAAGHLGAPLLLVPGNQANLSTVPKVAAEISRLAPTTVYIAGGTGAVSTGIRAAIQTLLPSAVQVSFAGANRYETATKIADAFFQNPAVPPFAAVPVGTVYIASGLNFPDALAGAALAGWKGAPLLLVPGTSPNLDGIVVAGHKIILEELGMSRLFPNRIIIFGSSGAVSTGIFNQLAGLPRS